MVRLAILAAGLLAASAGQGQTLLHVDARDQPAAPESGYLRVGTSTSPTGETIGINSRYLTLNGKPWLPVMGEFHFTRVPNRDWEQELAKIKASGVDVVSTYIFWNHHEEHQGRFLWTGDRDLRRFVDLCAKVGLKVIVRPGPWVHSEARFGGIPDWVVQAMPTRGNDPTYLRYVARFWGEVSNQLKGLLWKDGGPVIGMQLENEYNITGPGRGREHIAALKRIALEAGFDLPLYTVTGWDNTVYPHREVVPLFGGYADEPWGLTTEKLPPPETYAFRFGSRTRGNLGAQTTNASQGDGDADITHTPFLGAEFGGGVPTMYRRRPRMAPDDVAAMLPVALGSGVNLYGYYMFHGGQNSPDRNSLEENTSIGAYNDLPIIDYDFQAPLGAYGQQHPAMNKIRPTHLFLQAFGQKLAPMVVRVPVGASNASTDLVTPRFSVRSLGDSGFLFVNNYVRQYAMAVQKDVRFAVDLPSGTTTFPSRAIDIPPGAYFIWPINMDLAGVRLAYATAQPVTRIDDRGTPVFVFQAEDGIAPELAIDAAGVAAVTTRSGSVRREGGRFIISGIRPGTGAGIDVKTATGSTVRLVILSKDQAGHASLAALEGRSRLILTDAQLYPEKDGLVLLSTGAPSFGFSVFPGLDKAPAGNLKVKRIRNDGIFQHYAVDAAPRHPVATVNKIRDAREVPPLKMTGPGNTAVQPSPETFGKSAAWTISISGDAIGEGSDAFLRIKARGDVARLFSGVTMIDDHFLDGSVWEVGLKRFVHEIAEPLTLTILPLRRDAAIYLDVGVAAMASGDQTAELVDVQLVPQYRLKLSGNP